MTNNINIIAIVGGIIAGCYLNPKNYPHRSFFKVRGIILFINLIACCSFLYWLAVLGWAPDTVSPKGLFLYFYYPLQIFSAEIRALLAFLSLIYFLLIIYFEEKLDKYDLILTFAYYISGLTAIASQNLIVILLALEFLSLSATFLIAKSGRLGPALTYGILSFLSGAMFMAAISTFSISSMAISSIAQMEYFNKILLFLSIIMHCGLFPVSIAVVNGYAAASPTHAAFLQLFSTKASLIVLYKLFPAEGFLLYFSAATIIYSIIYSFKENSLRRLITYNTIGQVGLISLAIFLKGNIIPYIIVSALYQTLLFIIISQLCCSIEQPSQPLFTHLKGSIMRSSLALLALIIITASMMALPLTASFTTKAIMLETAHLNHKGYYYFFIIGNFLLVLAVPLRLLYSLFLQNSLAFEKFQLKIKSLKEIFISFKSANNKSADTYMSEIIIEGALASPATYEREILFSQTRSQKFVIILFSILLLLPPYYLLAYFLEYLDNHTPYYFYYLSHITEILTYAVKNSMTTYSFSHIIESLAYAVSTLILAFYFRKKLYNGFLSSPKSQYKSYNNYSEDIAFFCANFLPYLFSLFQKLLAYSHFLCQTYINLLIFQYRKLISVASEASETQNYTVEFTGLLAIALLGIFLLLRLIF